MFAFFKGPTKAAEAFGLTPSRYSVRLHDFLEHSLGEGKAKDEGNQKWSDAVRTKAAVNLTPQALPDALMSSPGAEENSEMYGSIRPLSHALTSKEIELQQKRLV